MQTIARSQIEACKIDNLVNKVNTKNAANNGYSRLPLSIRNATEK